MLRRLWNSSTLSLIVGLVFCTSLMYPTFHLVEASIDPTKSTIPSLLNSLENATFELSLNSTQITRGEDDLILALRFTYENYSYISNSYINFNITNPSHVVIHEEIIWINTSDTFYYVVPWQTFNNQNAGNYTLNAMANSTTTYSYTKNATFELLVLPFGRVRMYFSSSSVTLTRNQDNQVTCFLTNIGGTTIINVTVSPEIIKTGSVGSITRSYSIKDLIIASGDFHQDIISFYPDTYLYQKHSFTINYRTIDEPETERSYQSDPLEIIVPPEIVITNWELPDNVTIGEEYKIEYEVQNTEGVALYILPEVACNSIDFSESITDSIRITNGSHFFSIVGEPINDGVVSLTFSVDLEWTTVSETKWYSRLLNSQFEIVSIFPQELPPEVIKPEIIYGLVFAAIFVGLAYFSRDLLLGIAKKSRVTRDRIFPEVTYMYETAILDGSNIAWEEKSISNKPKISNIEAMINRLSRANFKKIITVADAALRYQIDEQKRLDQLVKEGAIKMLPARVDGDKFILRLAEEENGMIVSNDMFKEFREATPWIDERRIPYTILDGEVYLHPTSARQEQESENNNRNNNNRKENIQ